MSEVPRAEKDQIRDLFKSGYTMDEVRSRYPHVDGRVIAGLDAKLKQEQGAAEHPAGAGAPPQAGPAPPPPPPGPLPGSAGAPVVPRPFEQGVKAHQAEAAAASGFTPSVAVPHSAGGFRPNFQHYFVVKRLDGPNAGVIQRENPPFTINEFMARYRVPGEYEIQEYRDGRMFSTYSERVAPPYDSHAAIRGEEKKSDSPVDSFFKAVDAVHKLHEGAKAEAAQARAVEATVKSEEVRAKAAQETSATTALVGLLREQAAPKPDTTGPALNQILLAMQEQNRAAEDRHKRDMEELRERNKHDREMERERLKSEKEEADEKRKEEHTRWTEEMKAREKDRNEFVTRMAEIEKERDKFHRESYDRMMGEIKETREAVGQELEEKRKWMNDLFEVQKKNTDEIITLKKSMGEGAKDLEVAKVIRDGITGGLDRIGHRVDLLVNKGVIGPGGPAAGNGSAKTEAPKVEKEEKLSVLTDDDAKAEVQKPWFQGLKKEVLATLGQRARGLKLHGGILGQVVLESKNEGKGITTAHVHWLCSRTWPQVLENARDGITEDEMKTLQTEDGGKWFSEFQWFLSEAYNNSMTTSGMRG